MKSNEITIIKQIAFFSVVVVVLGFLYGSNLNSLSLFCTPGSGVFFCALIGCLLDNLSKEVGTHWGFFAHF